MEWCTDGWQLLSELIIVLWSLSRDRRINLQLNTDTVVQIITTSLAISKTFKLVFHARLFETSSIPTRRLANNG